MRAPAPASWPGVRDTALSGLLASLVLLVLVLAGLVFGVAGLAIVVVAGAGIVLLQYPGAVLLGTVALVILCEGPTFGIAPQTGNLYRDLVKGIMPLDGLLALASLGLALQMLRERRTVRLPPPLMSVALVFVVLATAAGIVVARAHGVGSASALLSVHGIGYLVLLPLLVVNVRVDARQARWVIGGALALAAAKGFIGLAAVALGRGEQVEGTSVLTYYEPTANWLMTVGLLGVLAAVVLRVRPPRWALVAAPLLLLALLLSYRRSFWIADAVGVLLVLLFGLASSRRQLVAPVLVLVAGAAWLLGGVVVQSDTPLAQRVKSLSPTQVSAKPEDRYRLDERANVIAEVRRAPLSGRGVMVPWRATERALPVEVSPTHTYVHFASLYWWLHFGILGLIAYILVLGGGLVMAWEVWKRAVGPWARAFGLGSLCAIVGLGLIETTATFTGVDLRFTVLFGAQLGLLAVLVRLSREQQRAAAPDAAPAA